MLQTVDIKCFWLINPTFQMPAAFRNPSAIRANIPQYLDEQLRFQHQMNIEAQREQLSGRGFPLVPGEVVFPPPSRTTLPLSPEDYRRFGPEMSRRGLQTAFPAPRRESSFVGLQGQSKKRDKQDTNNNNSRAKSSDGQDNNNSKLFSWLNSGFSGKQKEEAKSPLDQQWIMREREDMKSMPPVHISADFDKPSRGQAPGPGLDRSDKTRSSFGMILKDKFQKNPNMYFPDTGGKTPSKSPEYIETRKGSNTKLQDSLSDTDTLIHNMSEGSFEKGSSVSGGHSIGSNKSSVSSGKCSLDSMDGTPRMIRRSGSSITTPKPPVNTALILPTNPSVILNKKTIRNYVPTESNNMLRSFEDNRKSNQQQLVNDSRGKTKATNNKEQKSERKSSVEKLIDDFHRNLPSPPPSKVTDNHSLPFSDGDSLFSGLTLDEARVKARHTPGDRAAGRTGTVTSQASNWSVASSAASFDYHSVNSMENRAKKVAARSSEVSPGRKKILDHQHSSTLPSLDELDVGERIPPDGASAESPANTVSVRKVNEANNNNKTNNNKAQQVRGKDSAKDAVSDLMKASENDEELDMLRKLISEGRISGLNEKPPPFIPPTPPSKLSPKRQAEGQTGSSKTNEVKSVAAASPGGGAQLKPSKQETSHATKSGDRPRKTREAPKPPTQEDRTKQSQIQGSSTADIKFIAGRRINSVESINDDKSGAGAGHSGAARRAARRDQKNDGIKRSTSMHVARGNQTKHSTPTFYAN